MSIEASAYLSSPPPCPISTIWQEKSELPAPWTNLLPSLNRQSKNVARRVGSIFRQIWFATCPGRLARRESGTKSSLNSRPAGAFAPGASCHDRSPDLFRSLQLVWRQGRVSGRQRPFDTGKLPMSQLPGELALS